MLSRLLGWGKKPKKSPRFPRSLAEGKVNWIDGPDGWIKKSSTSLTLQAITKPESPTEIALDLARRVFSPSIDGSASEMRDALKDYRDELNKITADLKVALETWKQLKGMVIRKSREDGLPIPSNDSHHHVHEKLSFIAQFFDRIKSKFVPAEVELRSILKHTSQNIQELRDHLNENCINLKNATYPEKYKLFIDMCNDGISINNDLSIMIDHIKSELDYCVKMEQMTERAAGYFVELILSYVLKLAFPDAERLSLPELEVDFSPQYRHQLMAAIKNEKNEINRFETDVIGTLDAARDAIQLENDKAPSTPKII